MRNGSFANIVMKEHIKNIETGATEPVAWTYGLVPSAYADEMR